MANNDEDAIKMILTENLPGIDQDTIEYFYSLINETDVINNESIIKETLVPFIESYGIADSEENAGLICSQIFKCLSSLIMNSSGGGKKTSSGDEVQLLDKMINLSVTTQNTFSQTEQAALDSMWGFEKIRSKKNDVMESTESGSSAREERKAAKEQKKWLSELDSKFVTEDGSPVIDDENVQISNMTLPEYSSGRNEKDIQVNNISITFGGKLLLDGADIRIVYTRRYGLIGKNGVGKTTLLRHMASFDIEGFPRHHRILHVKQEVNSSSCKSVLEVVLESDVERTQLLARQKKLIALQQTADSPAEVSAISEEMTQVYERLALIGSDSAESRAAAILSGLRFTESMQHSSTSKLSGGWLMRVALAAALFIEPDVLMLDEPTNHLDLEAVIWLQNYLLQYPHTILLVSHDRTFLNEVCTDMVLFKDLKLTYYRGNFDTYEKTRYELELLQKRQHEAQQAKLAHMQEFVDKFRYNANRAALVQSRIKTMNKEREELVEEVIDEAVFQFSFPDAGSLGSNVIKLQQVSFSYSEPESSSGTMKGPGNLLFSDVDMSLEQTSRIALVGPNGAGKSTLMNLIQGKLRPTEGFVNVNGQLRLAVFTQHHLDSFDLKLSPLHNMMQRWPLATEPELRAHLGNYEITGNDALKPMKFTSGGQKSRVAFACLTFTKPHVVLLDEPTNHLDMGAIGALIDALKGFSGGVLVISHDQHFIKSVCNEVWVVGGGRVKRFNGSFDDYKKSALESSKILAAQQQQQSKKK